MLTPAPSLSSYARSPTGHWWGGPSFAAWCAEPTFFGFTLYGQPRAEDLERLVGALKVELGSAARPHVSLVDASLVRVADPAAFEVLQRYVTRHLAQLRAQVTRLALVRPGGLPGAVVAGFFSVLESPYPTTTVTTVGEAVTWLGAPARWTTVLERLRAEVSGVDPLRAQVRAALAASPGASLATVARELGLSSRTLQRRLSELGTSLQRESSEQRLQAAALALATGSASILSVALEAGFSTSQAFSAAFRRFSGKTPREFRQGREVADHLRR